jgi:hypothetical protein
LTFTYRSIIVSFIILLSLVAVACGELKISVYTGDAGGCSGYTEYLGAKTNDHIQESTTLAGSCLSHSFKGSGDKTETFSITNKAGDHAEVGFGIKNSKSYSGSYTLSPKAATFAQATEKLDVDTADLIHAFANAASREGITVGSSIDVTKGSLMGYANSAYATSGYADAWQSINSASGEKIDLYAGASDKLVKNFADSSVRVDQGFLENYRSEANGLILTDGNIDLYAMHGPFNIKDGEINPNGKIYGDQIKSEGLTFNQNGLTALYGVTINYGSIEGRFDWGTETKSNNWVIAAPLESPLAWGGTDGEIKIYAAKICSSSVALDRGKVVSNDKANAKWVSTNDWVQGYGFAESSQANKT